MNMKSLIITGFAATILATTFSTTGATEAQASTTIQSFTDNTYENKKMEQELQSLYKDVNSKILLSVSQSPYFKRELTAAKAKANIALKKKNYAKMAQAKAELERLYDELDRSLYPDNY
ncbi:complement inhibitor SCIN family protein [Staphylococcus chromogenes]|uniref:complement inhibitor SCIN family protein n=1 Tax=Staphylococcus chromogenes TaxID=46126 RepID=UPI003D7B10CC